MRLDGSLKKIWDERLRFRPFYPSVELTDNGLMFGAGTQLAPLRNDNSGAPGLDAVRDRDRILALLSAAYGRPVPFDAMRHIEGASDAWRRGDKALANIRLAYARLPRFERHEDAYPLFLAASLLKAGFSPRYLMRQSAFDATALDIEKYNPDELRVPAGSGRESGWWTTDDWTAASDGQSGSYIQFASEDSDEEAKRKEDEKELPEAERRALNAAPRKEDVEEGGGIPLPRPLVDEGAGTSSTESDTYDLEGDFSITDWAGYPASLPKPVGPFRILEGDEYNAARAAANKANRVLRAGDPEAYAGKQIHEVQPVKFGGSPTDPRNKIVLSQSEHSDATTWWDRLLRYLYWSKQK